MNEEFKIEIEDADTNKIKDSVYTRIHYGDVVVGKKKNQIRYSFHVLEFKQNDYLHIELHFFEDTPKFDCKKEIYEKLKLNG